MEDPVCFRSKVPTVEQPELRFLDFPTANELTIPSGVDLFPIPVGSEGGLNSWVVFLTGWFRDHGADPSVDLFAGLSIIGSVLAATAYLARQTKHDMDQREKARLAEVAARRAEEVQRREWEEQQANAARRQQIHIHARGAAISALTEASRDFSLMLLDDVRALTSEIEARNRVVSDSPQNILMRDYNGEDIYSSDDLRKALAGLDGRQNGIDFAEVPMFAKRSTSYAMLAEKRSRDVQSRVLPFFDALSLPEEEISHIRNASKELKQLHVQMRCLSEISEVWDKFRTKAQQEEAQFNSKESGRSADAGSPVSTEFLNALDGLGRDNSYSTNHLQWVVDSVEGGRGALFWSHFLKETHNRKFWESIGRYGIPDFAEKTAQQYLTTHLIRVHEWFLEEIRRLLHLIENFNAQLLSRLGAATRAIIHHDETDKRGATYKSYLDKYLSPNLPREAWEIKGQPLSSYSFHSENVRLADQDPRDLEDIEYADLKKAEDEAMRDMPIGLSTPRPRRRKPRPNGSAQMDNQEHREI